MMFRSIAKLDHFLTFVGVDRVPVFGVRDDDVAAIITRLGKLGFRFFKRPAGRRTAK